MAEEFRVSGEDIIPFDEKITVTKTEVKVECCDFDTPPQDVEFLNVKEEYISSPENNFECTQSTEHTLNENVFTENCQLREEDLQKETECHKVDNENPLETRTLVTHGGEPKKYKCGDCKYDTHLKHRLQRHVRTHTKDRPFKCTFKNCKCIAGQDEFCRCDMCGYAAGQEYHLKKHILEMHSKETKKYKCLCCNYTTHRKENLQRHTSTHTNDRPFKCTYKNCNCTPEQKEFCKCDMCGYTAKVEFTLKKHILAKHSEQRKKYSCTECNYITHLKKNLQRHIHTHTNYRPFKCTYKNCNCTVEQEGSCKCDMCGYAAAAAYYLKMHILMKHVGVPKKYKCANCKYTTHYKQRLQRHVRTHTDDKPFKCTYKNCECTAAQKEFCKCDMCGYAATQKVHLRSHILVKHSSEPKKYNCTDCEYTSHRKESLQRHIRTHTNDT